MHMPNRRAKFSSAVFATVLVGAALTTPLHARTVAADDCLSSPKGDTPPGRHWHYRIEHGTKRQCWYLRGEGDKASQAAPVQIDPPQATSQKASPSAQPFTSQTDAGLQRSIADAHAEQLPSQANGNDEPNPSPPVNPPPPNETLRTDDVDADAPSTVVASRWPESSNIGSTPSGRPSSNQVASVPPDSIAAPTPAVATDTSITGDSSPQGEPDPIPRWLVAAVGPLTIGMIVASVFFRFGRSRQRRAGAIRAHPGPIWEPTDDDHTMLSEYPDPKYLPRRRQLSRRVAEATDPDDRMAEFFSRISERAPT
jgi:hypothetical protein